MAGAGDVILVMGFVGVPAGLLIAYGTNFNGFKDWFDSLFGKGGVGSFLPAYGPEVFPTGYTNDSGVSKTSAKQLSDAGLGSNGRPKSASSSGNCSWDTKGGFCWASSACGKPFKVCATYPAYTSVNYCCSAIKDKFLQKAPKCSGSTAPKPAADCPKTSGNCSWDCKNSYCWKSNGLTTGVGGKVCKSNTGITNRTSGCNLAKTVFLQKNCIGGPCNGLQNSAGTCKACLANKSLSARSMSVRRAFAGRRIPIKMSTSYR
jgi:hypothetical protein